MIAHSDRESFNIFSFFVFRFRRDNDTGVFKVSKSGMRRSSVFVINGLENKYA